MLLAVGLCAAPGFAQPRTTVVDAEPGDRAVDQTTTTTDINFTNDRRGRMTVPVRVDGSGPFRFLVDTGSDRTVISTAIASRLKLALGPTATLHSITGKSVVQLAEVANLELTAGRVRDVEAPLLNAAHMGADGILGVDSLRSQRVTFDFKKQLISMVPSEQRVEREDPDTIVVRGKLKHGHLIVTKARSNGVGTTVVLDTGAELSVGNEALRRRLIRRRGLSAPEPLEIISVTGQKLVGEAYRVKSFEVGGITMRDLLILFADAHTFRKLELEDRPAILLGMNAMRAFDRMSIDFANKKLRVLLPETSSAGSVMMAAR
jgi:predicted aspartyl protease